MKPGHLAVLSLLIPAAVQADPLHDPDNGALSGMFSLPDSTESALLVPRGRTAASMSAMVSSHSTDEVFGDESLTLDGETTRLELGFRYGLTERLEIGLRIPYVWHETGTLDSLVEDFHKAFGLPNGKRDNREKDLLEFSYRDATGELFDYQSRSDGFGDARLIAGYRLTDGANHTAALRLGVKLPTGDSDEFHGSGGTDLSVGIAGDLEEVFSVAGLNGFYRAHLNFIGEPDLLTDRYEDIVWQVSTGLGYPLTRAIEARVQAVARSALYDSKIEILGQTSVWIMLGANIRLSDNYQLSLGIAEDVKVRSAPDVSFQLALRYRPRTER